MRKTMRRAMGVAAGVLAAWALAPSARALDIPAMHNLRIPLEHFEDGKIKTQITAGTAEIGTNGNIQASNVKIEMFSREGRLETQADAGSCFVDREKQLVTSDAPIRITQKGMAISGQGFEWHASDQSFKIRTKARVVFFRDQTVKFWKHE